MTPMFQNFLNDPNQYAEAEHYWQQVWDRIVDPLRLHTDWHPWIINCFANGTAIRDGNPIFNRSSKASRRCVRVIQEEFTGAEPAPEFWLERLPRYATSVGGFDELVIRCELTDVSAELVGELMGAWVTRGEITLRSHITEVGYDDVGAETLETEDGLQLVA